MPPTPTVTGADTSELFALERRIGAMIDQVDGVISQGPGFVARLVRSWLGPLAELFNTSWQQRDLPSISHVRDSLHELKEVLTKNRIEQERASGDRDTAPVDGHGWERTIQPGTQEGSGQGLEAPYPTKSYRAEFQAAASFKDFFFLGGRHGPELVALSDGTYLVRGQANGFGGAGIPGIGVEVTNGADVTLHLTAEELKHLTLNGLVLPSEVGDQLADVDAQAFNPADKVTSVKVELGAGGFANGIAVPEDLQAEFDKLDADARAETTAEARKNANGEWEVVLGVNHATSTNEVTNTGHIGGRIGENIDRFSHLDLSTVKIDSQSSATAHEVVYNTATGETYLVETTTERTGDGEGRNVGVDKGILGTVTGDNIGLDIASKDSGTFDTETTVTTKDLDGRVRSTQTTSSSGTGAGADLELLVGNTGGGFETETFQPPRSESRSGGFD